MHFVEQASDTTTLLFVRISVIWGLFYQMSSRKSCKMISFRLDPYSGIYLIVVVFLCCISFYVLVFFCNCILLEGPAADRGGEPSRTGGPAHELRKQGNGKGFIVAMKYHFKSKLNLKHLVPLIWDSKIVHLQWYSKRFRTGQSHLKRSSKSRWTDLSTKTCVCKIQFFFSATVINCAGFFAKPPKPSGSKPEIFGLVWFRSLNLYKNTCRTSIM